MTKPRQPGKWRVPLTVLSAGLITAVAGLTGASLWYLRRMPDTQAHTAAARSVVLQGAQLVRFISGLDAVRGTNAVPARWRQLHLLVSALHAAQSGLQYVEISRDGVTQFHRQTEGLESPPSPPPPAPPGWPGMDPARSPVRLTRQILETGDLAIPVMVFHQDVRLADGGTMSVEVALRRDTLGQQQQAATEAVDSMFRIALVTTASAFALCLGILVWAVHRDRRRELRRRQEEHLVFSGVLANGIVHDFRNPMSAVRLDAQMLEREVQRPEGPRAARLTELSGRISRTMARMDDVFKEFLYLAKPGGESREALDLRQATEECLETLAPRFEQAGVGVVRAWPETPLLALATATSLKRALINVLLNALQFSPAGAAVEVAASGHGSTVRLEVRDRGPGIPLRERQRVFEMFTTTRPGGTGLGLFLARTALTNSGGQIEALSREGGGTVIRMTLAAPTAARDLPPPPGG